MSLNSLMTSINTERRQFRRYSTVETAFAVLRPTFQKLGKIKNISKGGLSFEYIVDENHQNSVEDELLTEIDVFSSREMFYIPRIPCKIINDGDVVPDNSIITSVPMRRCGIQFVSLNPEAVNLLDSCLTRCEP